MNIRYQAAVVTACIALALGGCTGGDDGTDNEPTSGSTVTVSASPNLVDDDGRFFAITEVGFTDGGHVLLANFTSVPASLAGLYLCEPPKCVALPDVDIDAGALAAVAVGDGSGLEDVVLKDADLDLDPANGEVGLYASEEVESTQDIRAYLEWGSTPHEGTATAIDAGLWLEGSYVNSSADATRVFKNEVQQWDWE